MHSIAFDCLYFFSFLFLVIKTHGHSGYILATLITAAVGFVHQYISTKTSKSLWQKKHLVLLPFPNLALPEKVDVVGVVC